MDPSSIIGIGQLATLVAIAFRIGSVKTTAEGNEKRSTENRKRITYYHHGEGPVDD